MTNILEQHEQLKAELKDKWLDYYQSNQFWLKEADGNGYRFEDPRVMLGIITALEPKSELKELLQYFLLVTKSCDSIIKALGLDFDPELELKKRLEKTIHQQTDLDSQYLDQVRKEIKT